MQDSIALLSVGKKTYVLFPHSRRPSAESRHMGEGQRWDDRPLSEASPLSETGSL